MAALPLCIRCEIRQDPTGCGCGRTIEGFCARRRSGKLLKKLSRDTMKSRNGWKNCKMRIIESRRCNPLRAVVRALVLRGAAVVPLVRVRKTTRHEVQLQLQVAVARVAEVLPVVTVTRRLRPPPTSERSSIRSTFSSATWGPNLDRHPRHRRGPRRLRGLCLKVSEKRQLGTPNASTKGTLCRTSGSGGDGGTRLILEK